jgi:AcrR family transcriptional regulator
MVFTYRTMVTRNAVRDHISSAILDAAAGVLSKKGDTASMEDVAAAAGMGRASVYRYFPRRDDLLCALAEAALEDAHRRITEADLDRTPVPEALARVARAMVACGTKFAVLTHDRSHIDRDRIEALIGRPVRAVFQRGQADGTLRADVTPDMLAELFGGLMQAAWQMTAREEFGVERASAAMTSLFLDGARAEDL